MKLKSRKSGISLISLIITIIVIIILAAVVIFSGMDTPEKAQLSKVISDIDNVQTAVDQAYYGLYTEKAVAGEVWTQSQFYEAIATGETDRNKLSGDGLIEIGENSLVDINLTVYEGRKWYVAVSDMSDTVKTGSAVLSPGFESQGKTYATLLDIQNGGSDGAGSNGGNQDENKIYIDPSGEGVLKIVAENDMLNENWKDKTKVKEVLQAENETTQVPIPVGFDYYLGTAETGLVITDASKNEFVWIPKMPKYWESNTPIALYGDTGVTTTKYGDFKYSNSVEPGYVTSVAVSEPDLVESDIDSSKKYYEKAGFSSAKAFAEDLVNEFGDMIESVKKYGGFYVGRYELGYSNGNIVCKPNVLELTASAGTGELVDAYGKYAGTDETSTWYGLYKACKGFSSGSLHSNMMWGSQWDVMVDFIGDEETSNDHVRKLTGQYGNEYKHVHDVSNSVCDWLTQAFNGSLRASRGSTIGASYRDSGIWPYATDSWAGTRVQLYIK